MGIVVIQVAEPPSLDLELEEMVFHWVHTGTTTTGGGSEGIRATT